MTAKVIPLPAAYCVYVLGPEDGPQKVGVSNDLRRRLVSIQNGNHLDLCIAAAFPVQRSEARMVEKFAHRLLWEFKIRGEWFDVTPEQAAAAVMRAVAALRNGEEIPCPKRAGTINVRLSEASLALLEEAAAERGLTVSSFMRMAALALAKRVD